MIVFARLKPGLASESRRTSHIFDVPESGDAPQVITALCGQQFPPGALELMDAWCGMPCVACTLRVPRSFDQLA